MVRFKGSLTTDANKKRSRQEHLTSNFAEESQTVGFLLASVRPSLFLCGNAPLLRPSRHPQLRFFYQVSKRWELVASFLLSPAITALSPLSRQTRLESQLLAGAAPNCSLRESTARTGRYDTDVVSTLCRQERYIKAICKVT